MMFSFIRIERICIVMLTIMFLSISTAVYSQISEKNYSPCLLMEKKAQDAYRERSKKIAQIGKNKKAQLSKEDYRKWFACEDIKANEYAISVIDRYKNACLNSCKKSKQNKNCDSKVTAAKSKYLTKIEMNKKFCTH